MHTILVVLKDISLASKISAELERKGLFVVVCHFLESAVRKNDQYDFDLAILGEQLPDGNGEELLEFFQDHSFQTRCLMLVEKFDYRTRINYLKKGVEDTVCLPLNITELALKVDQLRFRRKVWQRDCLTLRDDVKLYPDEGVLQTALIAQTLRRREAQILHCLLLHKNRVVTREMLVRWVWGNSDTAPKSMTLDVYIKRLRFTLGKDAVLIETIRGFGYRLNSTESDQLYPKLANKAYYLVDNTRLKD